jgi:hypothetical protein
MKSKLFKLCNIFWSENFYRHLCCDRCDGGIIAARNWMERSDRQRLAPSAFSGKASKIALKGPKHENFGSEYYTTIAYLSGQLKN